MTPVSPTELSKPAFLLNVPFSYRVDQPNNAWAVDHANEKPDEPVNWDRALGQWCEFYQYLSSESIVYLLPTPPGTTLQDLVFTANLGLIPSLTTETGQQIALVSNYASLPRVGEEAVGAEFLRSLGYDVQMPPSHWEGEAELKHLHDNIYIGGWGQRSTLEAYEWMELNFDMKIIKVHETDPYLYHLDCTVFPVTEQSTMVCTEMFDDHELRAIEGETEIIDVSYDDCMSGVCNNVRLTNTVLNASHILELKRGTEDYAAERQKNSVLEDICAANALEVAYFNLSEFLKGGAVLSCCVMHLNRFSYKLALL
jgi:N-dimethylarginine dimethylaminohydrolase